MGGDTFTLSCPVSPHEELPQTELLIDISHYRTGDPPGAGAESTEPFPWAPPFYLAPLYHPHPTYRHGYPGPYVYDAYNPGNSPPAAPDPAFGPQLVPDSRDSPEVPVKRSDEHFSSSSPAGEMEDSSPVSPDLQRQSVPEADGATTEAPHVHPPGHAVTSFYHYYHHPKIPLPGPGPEVLEQPSSDQFPPPVLQTPDTFATRPDLGPSAPEPHVLHPPHLYPFHYLTYISKGEARRVALLHPDVAAETNVSVVPFAEQHNPEWIRHPALNDKRRLPPSSSPGPVPAPLANHHPPPPPHPYHFYPHRQYHGPGTLQSAEKQESPTSRQTAPSATLSLTDVQNPLLNPHYSFYGLHLSPAGAVDSGRAESQPSSDHSRMDLLARGGGAGSASVPQPPFSFSPHHVAQERPQDPDEEGRVISFH